MSIPPCLKCNSEYVYQDQELLICPECAFEWSPLEVANENAVNVKDANGTLLEEGDKVTLAKDLKVKGSSLILKIGTKALIRRINDGKDHQLDCKVDGAGEMVVTAKFVKKIQM
jgi:protein PhnA